MSAVIRKLGVGLIVAAALLAPGEAAEAGGTAGTTTRVSVASDGTQGNDLSCCATISNNGQYIAFISYASNLVPGDTNATGDVFVHDVQTGQTERVNVSSSEVEANGDSAWGNPSISGDGRYVAFTSKATNLIQTDANNYCDHNGDGIYTENCLDVFLRDRELGTTRLISRSTYDGSQGYGDSFSPSVSADFQYVAFASYAGNLPFPSCSGCSSIFLWYSNSDEIVGPTYGANGSSFAPAAGVGASAVAYYSYATNLVPGDDNNFCDTDSNGLYADNCPDVFLYNPNMGGNSLVSHDLAGNQGNGASRYPAISDNGGWIGYTSDATNLVPVDANGATDVFTQLVGSGPARASVSSSGSEGNKRSGSCCQPVSLEEDGRFTAFHSEASNLVAGDTNAAFDVFMRDRVTGRTIRVSVNNAGEQGDGVSGSPSLSASGRYVSFDSDAANLVSGDDNTCQIDGDPAPEPCIDVFLRDLGDSDSDAVWDPFDNCVTISNAGQTDGDIDGVGNVCDNCPAAANANQTDTDGDTAGDACDDDDDDDSVLDASDNCPTVSNAGGQLADVDGDLAGDACDGAGAGNVDCSPPPTGVNAVDALKVLRYSAGLSVSQSEPCLDIGLERLPPGVGIMGDVNCSGGLKPVNAVDALLVLRAVAELPVAKPVGCPEVKPL